MTIHANCPKCGRAFELPDNAAGRKARCSCGGIVSVPVTADLVDAPPSGLQSLLSDLAAHGPTPAQAAAREPLAPAPHPGFQASQASPPARRAAPGVARLVAAIGGVVGGVAGLALGLYGGVNFLLPLLFILLAWLVATRAAPEAARPLAPAFAIQAGQHLGLIALALLTQSGLSIVVDAVLVALGLAWLLARPSLGPVIALTVFQAIVIFVHRGDLSLVPAGTPEHRVVVVHLVLRLASIVYTWAGWYAVFSARRRQRDRPGWTA